MPIPRLVPHSKTLRIREGFRILDLAGCRSAPLLERSESPLIIEDSGSDIITSRLASTARPKRRFDFGQKNACLRSYA